MAFKRPSNEQLDAATPQELAELTGALLARQQPGYLPLPVFQGVARLSVISTIEVVGLELADSDDPKVLLTVRPESDQWWPGQLHIPGSVLLPDDEVTDPHDVTAPVKRIFDELDGVVEQKGALQLFDLRRRSGPRGSELTPMFWAEIGMAPDRKLPDSAQLIAASQLFEERLEAPIITGHLRMAQMAIEAYREPISAINRLISAFE